MKQSALAVYVAAIVLSMSIGLYSPEISLAEAPSEIVIGAHLPLTGPLSGSGKEQKWSYEQAVKDVNAKGGIPVREFGKKLKVKLLVRDDESKPMKAALAVDRLIRGDKVDMLLGGNTASFGVIPGCMIAEKNKKYYHASVSLIPPWLDKKFKWSTLFFFSLDQAALVPFQIWNTLPKEKRPKHPALLMENTFDGKAFADLFRSVGKKHGVKFTFDKSLPVGSKDYTKQIKKLKEMDVDAILIFASTEDCVRLVRQMKEHDYSVPYFHGLKGTWSGEFWKTMGKDAQYILCDGFWSMDYPYWGSKQLGERYHEEFGTYSVSIGATYALCQILFQAIEKAGTLDGAKVREAVLADTYETVMGPVSYGLDGVAVFPCTASQWWNGKQMTLYPFDLATWTLRLAPPWNRR